MTFAEFLRKLENEQQAYKYYLTTQNSDGAEPEVLPLPGKLLAMDFPIRPQLLKGLIPQNINMWMGQNQTSVSLSEKTVSGSASAHGTSTGLHHDFHDNLYILLRGLKRFRLFSPREAGRMYTRGVISCVHPNGRICYEGEVTNADGSDLNAHRALEAALSRELAEKELAKAEENLELGVDGASEQVRLAEEKLEAAIELMLDVGSEEGEACEENWSNTGSEFEGEEDDNIDSEFDSATEDSEAEVTISRNGAGAEEAADPKTSLIIDVKKSSSENSFPSSFSRVDLGADVSQIAIEFPMLSQAHMVTCELRAGDMLYLPAGWFHEVTSFGGQANETSQGGHFAFNYWFHPPDNLDPSPGGFKAPYSTNYWENNFHRKHPELL